MTSSGTPIAGAEVILPIAGERQWGFRSTQLQAATARTNNEGKWALDGAPEDASGFATTLRHPDYSTTVYAESAVVQTANAEKNAVLEERAIESLVARGRDPLNLLRTMPGVQADLNTASLGATTDYIAAVTIVFAAAVNIAGVQLGAALAGISTVAKFGALALLSSWERPRWPPAWSTACVAASLVLSGVPTALLVPLGALAPFRQAALILVAVALEAVIRRLAQEGAAPQAVASAEPRPPARR